MDEDTKDTKDKEETEEPASTRDPEPSPEPSPEPGEGPVEGSPEEEPDEGPEEAPGPALAKRSEDEDEPEQALEKAEKEKAQANEELLKTRERMLRIAADFENFRKRSKRDLEEAEHKARVGILKEMLPVFDNLARAVEHADSVQDVEPIIKGAQMVSKQFEENLAKFGLRRIKSVGEVFDPSVHDAIAQEESEEHKPGTVMKEFLAGYMLGEKLLRASMVIVAKPGGAKKKDDGGDEEEDG